MKKIYFFRTILTGLILLITLSGMTQVTLSAADDGTARKEIPEESINTKHATNIFVWKTDTTEAIAFVKFEIGRFQGKIVSEAIFSTRAAMKAGKTMTVKLTKVASSDFTRDSLTWSNKPGTSDELATVELIDNSARKEYTPNGTKLADYINEALAQGKQYIAFGIQFKSGDGGEFSWAGGKGDGSYGPQLALTFDEGFNYWPVADGVAFKENADTTAFWKGNTNIYIWKTDTTEAIAFVKFSLPGFANKTVTSAEFSTRSDMNDGKTMTVALLDAKSTAFSRETVTWDNKPGTGAELATVLLDDDSGRKMYIQTGTKLIDYINGVLALGKEDIAFALKYKSGDGGDFKWMGGKGDGSYGPMLKVTEGIAVAGYASDDGFATQNHPDSTANAFANTNIFVSKSSDTTEQVAYVKFNISAFAGRTVENVKFSTRSDMNEGTTMTVGLHKTGTDFTRSELTWNNRPAVGTEVATVVMEKGSARRYWVSTGNALVDYVNEKLRTGAEEIAFALKYKEGDGADFKWCGGKGDATYGPLLEMEFGYGFNSYAVDDGSGFQENPDTTAFWKNNTNIFIYKTDTTQGIAYVKFDVSALAGKAIAKATFSTRAAMKADGKTMTVSLVESKGTNFTRNELTWNSRPATGAELATVVIERSSARKDYIPVGTKLVDYINGKLVAMEPEVAFAIKFKEGDGGDFSWCGGAGDGAYGPQLVMDLVKPVSIDTITVIEDAYALEAYPDSVGEGVADMQIGRDDAGNAGKETFLKFPLDDKEYPVGMATLVLKGALFDGNPEQPEKITVVVAGTSNAWGEDSLKWTNKPAEESEILVTYDITESANHHFTSDALTHYVNDVIRAGGTEISFVLKGKDDTGANRAWVSGKEWVPGMMILDYTVAPPVQEGNVIEDAYVSQVEAERGNNYGSEADQHLIKDDANESSKWIYFKYDLSKAYDNPVSATLKLYGSIHNTATEITEFDYQIFAANNNNWSEDTLTWNNKPGVGNSVLLEGSLVATGAWYELSSPAFSKFIADAVKDGKEQITLVAKGKDATPGNRAWISGKEWRASSLIINYEPQVEAPVFNPKPGEFIASVDVEIQTATPNATIFYTTDGTEPSDASTEYTGKITLNETSTLKAIGYAGELKPSIVASGEYIVHPVGVPEFFPSPLVTYTDDNPPVVLITVQPDNAVIYYSDDGSDPATPYPDGGIPISQTTTIRAQAYTADGTYSSDIVEATYIVEATVEGIGVGPGGVGYPDNSISGQPENTLWLMADKLSGLNDGDPVSVWQDQSGNGNDATDVYAGTQPADYHKTIEAAPVFVSSGVNNDMPAVNFGPIEGRDPAIGALAIPDEMNGKEGFDGMGGMSLWLVLKRNTVVSDFTAIVEKRNFYQGPEENAWVLQYNGGGGPDEFNFEIRKEDRLVTNGQAITDNENTYIIGTDLRAFDRVTFWKNGALGASMNYSKPINYIAAPLVIGNALKDNLAEVIFFKKELNQPQKVIVQNYLAAKYQIALSGTGASDVPNIYAHDVYTNEVIGVGKANYGAVAESHLASSGGALQLEAVGSTFEAGEFVFAGHNGAANSDDNASKTWARRWFIQKSEGAGVDIKLGFDFAAAGLSTPASVDGYAVYYSADGQEFAALETAGTMEGDVMVFTIAAVENGFYVLSAGPVTGTRSFNDMSGLVNLYPNPTTNGANVVINNAVSGIFKINIHNMTGSVVRQMVASKPAGPHTERFSVADLAPGVYIVEVIQGNNRALKRLVKN
ncbi:DNRLRE domain-containing protein [Mariniphaga sp.]|uniref:CBM96 family carbohydrate-binding protein n=1 Tax=Mariniphaga sp. TaxID=1954475 RepID=UPI0035663A47